MMNRLRIAAAAILMASVVALTVQAQSPLTTTFAGGNGQSGNMFDVTAINPISITSFDIHYTGTTTPITVEVWAVTVPGTYVGNEANAGAWTMLASFPGILGNPLGTPTPLPSLPTPFALTPGQVQGFYITSTGGGTLTYTNGTAQGALYTQNADLQFFEGIGDSYPFGGTFVPRIWNGNIHYVPTISDDLVVESIQSPVTPTAQCSTLGNAEPVTVRLRNGGSNVIPAGTPLTLVYTVDGTSPVLEILVLANNLNFGQTFDYTFTATANLLTPGPHTVGVTGTYINDLNPTNDQVLAMVNTPTPAIITTFPVPENFDGLGAVNGQTTPPLLWEQDPSDGVSGAMGDWVFSNQATANMSPSSDHSTGTPGSGFFAMVDDAGNNAAVSLLLPCMDLAFNGNPTLTFWVHSENTGANPTSTQNFLHVDALTYPGPVAVLDIIPPIGHLGSGWHFQGVNLAPLAGQQVQLRFRASTNNGVSTHNIAIDDVIVVDLVPGPGQAPQPGLAVLDLNGSVDGSGLPISFGANGPFFSSARAGDPLNFHFSGAPNQPIVFMAGPLNPALLVVPPVGQIDVGSGINAMNGLPTGIAVVADGTQVSLPNYFFRTQGSGSTVITFPTPILPLGVFTTFQSIFFTGGPTVVAISNAVELTIIP